MKLFKWNCKVKMRVLWRCFERLTPEFESMVDKGNLAQASERRHARGVCPDAGLV